MSQLPPLSPPAFRSQNDRQFWGQLHGASAALAILKAAQSSSAPTLLIARNSQDAHQLEVQLKFFNKPRRDGADGDTNQAGDQTVDAALEIFQFPDWEILPYDTFSPHQDIISDRLATLYRLPQMGSGIVIVPVSTLLHRLAPKDYVAGNALVLKEGQKFDLNAQRKLLEQAGYHCVDTVYEHGEFAVRGSLMDIFPMGSNLPYRIDLFDDEIESLRTFDPEDQRTVDKVDQIDLLPAREFPMHKLALAKFLERWHGQFDCDPGPVSIYQDISAGIAPAGIEYYLPLFFDECASLFDYLPERSQVFIQGDLKQPVESFWREAENRYESRRGDLTRPILEPGQVLLNVDEFYGALKHLPRAFFSNESLPEAEGNYNFATGTPPSLPVDGKSEQPLKALEAYLMEYKGRVLFCAESGGRREALLELLSGIRLKPKTLDCWQDFVDGDDQIAITVSPIDQGLILEDPQLNLIAEPQLFGDRVLQQRRRRKAKEEADNAVKNLAELRIDAPVVHIDHGVGRYKGLQSLDIDSQPAEFLTLEYGDGAKLYVPVASLHLISRYSGADEELAPLHKLGSESWQKAKRKAAEKVRDAAAELLDIYARREARIGHAFGDPGLAYREFTAGFPFEETPDQQLAIEAVVGDMLSDKPMDRLVCGDVGFGKTEVAMRAAFVAAHGGKQVAMLVPTTLLAQQHFQSLQDRFADWPISIEVISRFRSNKEVEAIKQRVAEGKVDILVGTHKLLQSDLKFKNLGLLIIDEEHRFGVRQKEKLKSLRSEVDILNLTATPIPRTLNMAMAGIRDLSVIATPPARRLSVKTFVRERDDALIKEAILREILRGGQVYFLHNEVKSIERIARELQELVPEARIGIGHGQMRERELEQVMSDFYHKRFNVLVCTTIIETGIDIPSANTILIERADKFGLAQLHQLRGRVGRSHHQAYAYLLTPNKRAMTGDAVKRLEAISEAQDLGAGFTLATHDLEIRGAGELLGEEQSGQIQSVGFNLYMEMLDHAVKAIREGRTPNIDEPLESPAVDVNLRVPALIPEDYLPDVHSRLIMYKRIANAEDKNALKELQVEMIDRFGLFPEPLKHLFRITEIKLNANQMGIRKLEASASRGRIEFADNAKVDPLTLVKLVQSRPTTFQLQGANHLNFALDESGPEQRLQQVNDVLQQLSQ
ncbi:transcription-repair coupling factor [Microbulbifer agarilyticus]|uniref:transcription-repair coupling factor n=1 Tax=Microbulbifer agarilyticus TaxID=260552 RepID=UPI001C945C40|nr:transcription-repair coupling factor [Microbulbifer agarilyticus]MBY6189210.1 transcription-repair coupling factor [Microbulbifer agarilyticus]